MEAQFLFHCLRIVKKRIEGEIMVFFHGTFIGLLIIHFLGKDLNSYQSLLSVIDNTGESSLILNVSEDLEQPRFEFQLLCYNCNIN